MAAHAYFDMIDTTLIDKLTALADKENKIKGFKRRLRMKGVVEAIGATKKGNITLKVVEGDAYLKFTILKSHKERFALAGKLKIGRSVSIEGIPKVGMIICTRLKLIEKRLNRANQLQLGGF